MMDFICIIKCFYHSFNFYNITFDNRIAIYVFCDCYQYIMYIIYHFVHNIILAYFRILVFYFSKLQKIVCSFALFLQFIYYQCRIISC